MAKKFLRDLQIGDKGMAMVQQLLATNNIDSEPSVGKNIEYDLKHNTPLSFTSEVKFDIYAARSGNIAIEFYNPKLGKPSGINATKADLWFHVITNPMSVWVTSVKQLKDYIENNKPHRVISCGGDDNASLYLYKQEVILPAVFRRLDDCPAENFMNILLELLRG